MIGAETETPRASWLAVASWALYDFANSIWPMNVITLYFALWVTVDQGARDIVYSVAFSSSMLLVALVSPMMGAVSDQYGKRVPFLIFFTLLCVGFTAMITRIGGLSGALIFFAIANFAFQSGIIYYDALLATVSTDENRGKISGLGVGLGYAGAIAGILMVKPFVDKFGRGAAFLPTAILFLIFAIPSFIWVKEPGAKPWQWGYLREGYGQLLNTLRNARRHANLFRFIIARFLYVDAISTVTTFMAVYTVKVIGFTDQDNQTLFIISTTFAIIGAFIYGFIADRIGSKKTITIVLTQWALVFVMASATFHKPVFWVLGPLAGLSLGAIWTSDRFLLARLAPQEQLGEFFGLYGLIGKLSAVIGPMIWGLGTLALASFEPLNYRITILMLLVLLGTGFAVLQTVQEPQQPVKHPL